MTQAIDSVTYAALRTVWVLVAVTFIFVLLRLYIRIKVLDGYRADDLCYTIAFSCLLIYVILVQVSAQFGFGREVSEIESPDDVTRAILAEMIGQTFLIIGNVASKLAITFFLIKLANKRTHKISIWLPVIAFAIFVTIALIVSWLSCQPTSHTWDPRVPGECAVDPTPTAVIAGGISVLVDFWYAGFPWYLLWGVNIAMKRKITILLSLSLGIIAGVCGIKRASELNNLRSSSYLKDTVELVVWHAAELSVTLIAIGISICFPIYGPALDRLISESEWLSRICGQKRGKRLDRDVGVFGLNTIGGTPYCGNGQASLRNSKFGENRDVLDGRDSIGFEILGKQNGEPTRPGLREEQGAWQCIGGRDSWASRDNVADGIIVVRNDIDIRTDFHERALKDIAKAV
ncbi:hypothetical protein F4802DRAFT_597082 [Xylaria palmicola]|nr:hypothetical protein F4802DRAFT_597082 [Xylaria palmicola]